MPIDASQEQQIITIKYIRQSQYIKISHQFFQEIHIKHCVKSVCIWSFSGPYFPAFGLNRERCSVSLRIDSKCGKLQTRITPNTDSFDTAQWAAINSSQVLMALQGSTIQSCYITCDSPRISPKIFLFLSTKELIRVNSHEKMITEIRCETF